MTSEDKEVKLPSLTDPDKPSKNSHRKDYMLLLFIVLLKLGDSVEIYFPGVITQTVSCELGVSGIQEAVLAVIFYLFMSVAIVISPFIPKQIGERLTLILSLYLSVVFVILCAIFPNYYTLLLSRAVTGMSVGINERLGDVFLVKLASSEIFVRKGSFLTEGLAMSVGGAWVSFLGWLTLDLVGWRFFILFISTPFFIPAIILLHCCMEGDKQVDKGPKVEENMIPSETHSLVEPLNDPKFSVKVIRSSLFSFSNVGVGYGTIILLPWMIRSYKATSLEDIEDGTCIEVVKGHDFLTSTLVFGIPTIVGNALGYLLWSREKFLIPHVTVTSAMAFSFGMILSKPSLVAVMVLFGVSYLCYSIQSVELSVLNYDYEYFGKLNFELGIYISAISSGIGAVVGTCFSAFLTPFKAVTALVVIICTELVVTIIL